jgi:hypothetical protein
MNLVDWLPNRIVGATYAVTPRSCASD